MTCLRVWQKPGFRINEHAQEEKSHEITSFEYIRDSLELSCIFPILQTRCVRMFIFLFRKHDITFKTRDTESSYTMLYVDNFLLLYACGTKTLTLRTT